MQAAKTIYTTVLIMHTLIFIYSKPIYYYTNNLLPGAEPYITSSLNLFLDWSPSYCENRAAYNTSANPAAPKIPAIGAAVLMAPALLVPELPAPPVEEAPVWLPVEEDPVADDDPLPVEEDPVAEEEWLPVEEDASELAVDEASLLEEAPVSWAEEPPPVTPLRALLTAPPAADVISPTILGGVRILLCGRLIGW